MKQKQHLKTSHQKFIEVIDEDGVVIDSQTKTIRYLAGDKESFFLAYSSLIVYLQRSKDVKIQLLASLMKRYLEGQEFSMGRGLKDIISKECNCSSRSLDLAFTNLLKDELIIKIAERMYRINPRYAFKGSSSERDGQLKLILELTCKDK